MLMEILALCFAMLSGVRAWQLLALALVIFAPAALVPPILYAVLSGRRPFPDRAPVFCDAVASELRSGATLRRALLRAAEAVSINPTAGGSGWSTDVGRIARAVASELPSLHPELVATVEAVARSGGSAADLFDELAAYAISQEEIIHEVRVATAPARATAWFFLLAPAGFLVYQVSRGAMTQLFEQPAQRITGGIGALLFTAGLIWMVSLLGRAR